MKLIWITFRGGDNSGTFEYLSSSECNPNQLHSVSFDLQQLLDKSTKAALKDHLHVLIVDDSISLQKIMRMSFQRAGHSVDVAPNGEVALEMMKKNAYDLVLMDFQMPVLGGVETVSRFRKFEMERNANRVCNSGRGSSSSSRSNSYISRLYIVGMTANGDGNAWREAEDCGMDAFLAKPFTIDSVLSLLHH